MSTRPRAEIMRDLKALLAELDYVMNDPASGRNEAEITRVLAENRDSPDLGHKLEQALEATRQPKTHDDIKQQARAYRPIVPRHDDIRPDEVNRPERKERLKDYSQVDDPDWPPDSTWMGTGDQS